MRTRITPTIGISTVVGFQGREHPIIIISTVRGNEVKEPSQNPRKRKRNTNTTLPSLAAFTDMGFMEDPRRINVATSRQKDALLIIGDPERMEQNKDWKQLIQRIHRNGALKSDLEELMKKK